MYLKLLGYIFGAQQYCKLFLIVLISIDHLKNWIIGGILHVPILVQINTVSTRNKQLIKDLSSYFGIIFL